jgi:hypothetical protein
MSLFRNAIPAFCLFVAATAAFADITETAPGRFICEAGHGAFVQEEISRFVPGATIIGHVRMLRDSEHSRFPGSGALIFKTTDDRSVGAYVTVDHTNPERVLVWIKGRNQRQMVATVAPRDASIPLSVTFGDDGFLTVRAGAFAHRLRMRRSGPVEPRIHCQSGRFEIHVASPATSAPESALSR